MRCLQLTHPPTSNSSRTRKQRVVTTPRISLVECPGKPFGQGPYGDALLTEAREGAHHGVSHPLENLYGGRSSRGHVRTMCNPARTLCRTPILKEKTAAACAHTALSICVNALCLKFPLYNKSVCGWHKDLEVAGKR